MVRRWAGVVLWCVGLAGAKPIETVLREQGGRVTLVSPESPAALASLANTFKGVECKVVAPADFPALKWPQKGDRAVFFLYSRDAAANWGEETLTALPKPVASVPANQVLACYSGSKGGTYKFELLASDYDRLRALLTELLALDAGRTDTHPDGLIVYELNRALAIGRDEARLRAWLGAQEQETSRFEVKVVDPAALRAADLEGCDSLLAALTYDDWQKKLDPTAREKLASLLPPESVKQLADPAATAAVSLTTTAAARCALVAAPEERFLPCLLGAAPAGEGLGRLVIKGWGAQGGSWTPRDLRGFARAAMLSSAASPELRAMAQQLGVSMRAALSERCGWQFVDDTIIAESLRRQVQEDAFQAGGAPLELDTAVDALCVLRLGAVQRRTEFREGEPRCTTERPEEPPAFTEYEPNVNARLYGIAGPKIYTGPDDPKYQEACRAWRERRDEANRKLEAWRHEMRTARVEWEQYEICSQTARVDGQLEFYDRQGSLLLAAQLSGVGNRTSMRTVRCAVQGFAARPPSLRLPAPREEAPAETVHEALSDSVEQACRLLQFSALTPRDGGFIPNPPPPPIAPLTEVVTVTGVAPAGNDLEAARQQARAQALRLAVEQVCGQYVESRTRVEAFRLLEDTVLTRADGFASIAEVVTEQQQDGELRLTCKVQVTNKPLREKVVAAGVARLWKVMVVVPERCGDLEVESPAVETALMKRLIEARLPVVDQAQSRELRQRREELLRIEGKPELARALALRYDARLLLTGSAVSQEIERQAGRPTCRADVQVRLIDLNTAEVIAADDQQDSAFEQTAELAGKAALRRASGRLSERLVDQIFRVAGNIIERLTLTADGFESASDIKLFVELLQKAPGVTGVRRGPFTLPRAAFELDIERGQSEHLGTWLEEQADDSLRPAVTAQPAANVIEAKVTWPKREQARAEEERRRAEEERRQREEAERQRREGLVTAARRVPLLLADPPAIKAPAGALVPLKPLLEWWARAYAYDETTSMVASQDKLTLEWNAGTRTITATVQRPEGSRVIAATLGSKTAQVDGLPVAMPAAASQTRGAMYVPLRFLADVLKLDLKLLPAGEAASLLGAPVPGTEAFRLLDGDRALLLAVASAKAAK